MAVGGVITQICYLSDQTGTEMKKRDYNRAKREKQDCPGLALRVHICLYSEGTYQCFGDHS